MRAPPVFTSLDVCHPGGCAEDAHRFAWLQHFVREPLDTEGAVEAACRELRWFVLASLIDAESLPARRETLAFSAGLPTPRAAGARAVIRRLQRETRVALRSLAT